VVCLLFFTLLFVSLAMVVLGGVLASYAGNTALQWAITGGRVTPVVALGSGELN